MKAWLWNGSAFEPANGVPISDRGFRFGMSLFESMCVREGAIEFWPQHQQRILSACAERDFPMPEAAVSATGVVFERAGISGFARIYVTAGDGGPAAPVTDARVFLIIEPREPEREDSWKITFHDDFYHTMFGGL